MKDLSKLFRHYSIEKDILDSSFTIKKREYTVQNGTTDLGNKTQHR